MTLSGKVVPIDCSTSVLNVQLSNANDIPVMGSVSIVSPTPNAERPFPMEGITMTGIQEFIERVGRDKLVGLNTTDVCAFVKELTKSEALSYCAVLQYKNSPVVQKANVFVSHAWKYNFLGVVDALQHQLLLMNPAEQVNTVFWFDLFSNNQHGLETAAPPFSWWCNTFMTAIKTIGKVLMVIEPWSNPITLTRAWCLWEVYCCFVTNSTFAVAMSTKETAEYRRLIVEDPNQFLVMLSQIDIRKSEAFNPLDRKQIFEVVEQAVGFVRLNQMVLDCVRRWTIKDLMSWLSASKEALQSNPSTEGRLQMASIMLTLSRLYASMDMLNKQVFDWLTESLLIRKELLGENNSLTLEVERQLIVWKINDVINGKDTEFAREIRRQAINEQISRLKQLTPSDNLSILWELYILDIRIARGQQQVDDTNYFLQNWNNLPNTTSIILKVDALSELIKFYHVTSLISTMKELREKALAFVVQKCSELESTIGNNFVSLLKIKLQIIRALPYSQDTLQEGITILDRLSEAYGENNTTILEALFLIVTIAFLVDNQLEFKRLGNKLRLQTSQTGRINDVWYSRLFLNLASCCLPCNSWRVRQGYGWKCTAYMMCPLAPCVCCFMYATLPCFCAVMMCGCGGDANAHHSVKPFEL